MFPMAPTVFHFHECTEEFLAMYVHACKYYVQHTHSHFTSDTTACSISSFLSVGIHVTHVQC